MPKRTAKSTPKMAKHHKKARTVRRPRAQDEEGYLSSDAANSNQQKAEEALNQMFNSLRVPEREPDHNTIGAETLQGYIGSLGASMETADLFVVLDIIQAEGIGQATRKGFVSGWKEVESKEPLTSTSTQRAYVKWCCQQVRQGAFTPVGGVRDYFRKVYRSAFATGKDADKRAVDLDVALLFWDMLLAGQWRTRGVDWLAQWKRFLADRWTRTVSRDMWNMTLEFAAKTMADDTLGFWDENGAWPGVIDEFVAWCRETGVVSGGASTAPAANSMEVDD